MQDTISWISYPTFSRTMGYAVREQACLALDGWTAVLRNGPYRVDWRSPDGHWTLGAPIPYQPIKVDAREKQVVIARRASGGTVQSEESVTDWPATVPPFTNWPPVASLDGKLLVHRTPTADFPNTRYDVINHRGELERQVTMPANEHIIGFGTKSVYVAVMGKDSTEAIERHPWP